MNNDVVSSKLLELLVCPLTRTTLEYHAGRQALVSRAAQLVYPIREGIPIMLPSEAQPLAAWLAEGESH